MVGDCKCSPLLMLRPLTVAKVPVTALPVKMVKVFPMPGTKLLTSDTLRVPFRLAPLATASWLYCLPTVKPPIWTLRLQLEFRVWVLGESFPVPAGESPAVNEPLETTELAIVPLPKTFPAWMVVPEGAVSVPSTVVVPAVWVYPPVTLRLVPAPPVSRPELVRAHGE